MLAVSADGASTNRKLIRMHSTSGSAYDPVYKTINTYSCNQRPLFFISDVPHLMKTVRNNWSHSFSHGCTRKLWVHLYTLMNIDDAYDILFYIQIRGKPISWRHLEEIYKAKLALSQRSNGLFLIDKLKLEHVQLTSFSRMRVDLAAQV